MQLISILVLLWYSSCSVISPHFVWYSVSILLLKCTKIHFPKCRIQITVHTQLSLCLYIAKCIRRNYIFRVFFLIQVCERKNMKSIGQQNGSVDKSSEKKISCRVFHTLSILYRSLKWIWRYYSVCFMRLCVCWVLWATAKRNSFQKTGGGFVFVLYQKCIVHRTCLILSTQSRNTGNNMKIN